jgi:uncharacterized protein YkwD
MTYLKTNFFFLILFVYILNIQAQNPRIGKTIYQESDLYTLLHGIENDKALQLERVTSLEFHNLLNAYRAKFSKKTIFWDERLWLAARNHNIYLMTDGDLSHNQSENTKYNTGFEPEDRVNYVTHFSNEFELAGFENCTQHGDLFSKVLDVDYATNLTWEQMVEKAREDAAECFDSWKNSHGHNSNMLDEDHIAHGTSIIYNDEIGSVVGTSVFANKQKFYEPGKLTLDFHSGWENDFKGTYKENYQPYIISPNKRERTISKHMKSFATFMKKNNIVLDKQLTKTLKNASKSETDSQLRKRYLRNTFYAGVFRLSKNELRQQTFNKVYSKDEFYSFKAVHDLKKHILETSSLKNATKWSGNLIIEEDSKGQLLVYLKTITLVPKK